MRMLLALAAAVSLLNTVDAQERKGLVVHEWGVFRVSEDVEFANADVRGEWDDLPEFVYGQIKGRATPVNWGAAEFARRPILFFHSAEARQLRVRVEFPGGKPGVWWPGTRTPAAFGVKRPPVGDVLEWEVGVKSPPAGKSPRDPAPKNVAKDHWIERLRKVPCDEIFCVFGDNRLDVDREKFIYYDGLFPQGKWLKVDVAGERVDLVSRVKIPVYDVTVVDRRRPDKVRLARIAKFDAGASMADVKFSDEDIASFASLASKVLAEQLTSAGLFADEGQSLVDLWRKELFETGGLHVFYRLPREEYDRRLPLTITPAADAVVRVGLVFQGHCEPDLAKRVLELVKQMDAAKFAHRESAHRELIGLGRAAYVELRRLQRTDLATEVRQRVEALLEKWDASQAFPRP